jgi:hypothetical protein
MQGRAFFFVGGSQKLKKEGEPFVEVDLDSP